MILETFKIMKKIRAYGTPEKKRKKRDEEMVYISKTDTLDYVKFDL